MFTGFHLALLCFNSFKSSFIELLNLSSLVISISLLNFYYFSSFFSRIYTGLKRWVPESNWQGLTSFPWDFIGLGLVFFSRIGECGINPAILFLSITSGAILVWFRPFSSSSIRRLVATCKSPPVVDWLSHFHRLFNHLKLFLFFFILFPFALRCWVEPSSAVAPIVRLRTSHFFFIVFHFFFYPPITCFVQVFNGFKFSGAFFLSRSTDAFRSIQSILFTGIRFTTQFCFSPNNFLPHRS